MDRNPRRGIHLPNTGGSRRLLPWEYEALGRVWPGSVSLLDFQLSQDPPLADWLRRRAKDGLEVYTRIYSPGRPDPVALAKVVADLSKLYPWVAAWVPANEPNIEWPGATWSDIDRWCSDFWWNAQFYRDNGWAFKVAFPPFAPGAPLDHRDGWHACSSTMDLYLNSGDLVAVHDYWAPHSDTMVEDDLPTEFKRPGQLLIHECGQLPSSAPDFQSVGPELMARYGNHDGSVPGRSVAHAVTPWLLADETGQFDGQAWVDREGGFRQPVFDWGSFGP